LKALNQYVKHDCNLSFLPEPEHYAAVFTKFHANGKTNKVARLHIGFAADAGCDNAIQEIKLLQVSVVPASLKSLD